MSKKLHCGSKDQRGRWSDEEEGVKRRKERQGGISDEGKGVIRGQ